MQAKTIDSFSDLHNAVQRTRGRIMYYRGVKDVTYKLIPKVGRYEKFQRLSPEQFVNKEKTILNRFTQEGWSALHGVKSSRWELLGTFIS